MPKNKGRKKGRNRERRERSGDGQPMLDDDVQDDASGAGPEARAVQQATVHAAQPMPTSFARATGLLLAVITGIVGVYVLRNGIQDDSATAGAARVVVGVLVLLLALVVGVLSVAPELVASLARRRRS